MYKITPNTAVDTSGIHRHRSLSWGKVITALTHPCSLLVVYSRSVADGLGEQESLPNPGCQGCPGHVLAKPHTPCSSRYQ